MKDKTKRFMTPLWTKFLLGCSVFMLMGFVVSTVIVEARENNQSVLTLERILNNHGPYSEGEKWSTILLWE